MEPVAAGKLNIEGQHLGLTMVSAIWAGIMPWRFTILQVRPAGATVRTEDGDMLCLTPAYDICPQGRTGNEVTQA